MNVSIHLLSKGNNTESNVLTTYLLCSSLCWLQQQSYTCLNTIYTSLLFQPQLAFPNMTFNYMYIKKVSPLLSVFM